MNSLSAIILYFSATEFKMQNVAEHSKLNSRHYSQNTIYIYVHTFNH